MKHTAVQQEIKRVILRWVEEDLSIATWARCSFVWCVAESGRTPGSIDSDQHVQPQGSAGDGIEKNSKCNIIRLTGAT